MKKVFMLMAALTLSAAMFLGCKKDDADSTALDLGTYGSGKITGTVYALQDETPVVPTTAPVNPVKKPLAGVTMVFIVDNADYDLGSTGSYVGTKSYMVTTDADGKYSLSLPVTANGTVDASVSYQMIRAYYTTYTAPVAPAVVGTKETEMREYEAAGAPATITAIKGYTLTQDIEYAENGTIPYVN